MLATWVWCPSAPPPAPCPPPQPLPAAFSLHKPIIYCCNKTDQSDSLKGHLSWRGHLHHLTFVEEAAHLAQSLNVSQKSKAVCGLLLLTKENLWVWLLTGTMQAAVPVANISSSCPLLENVWSVLTGFPLTWSCQGCRPWGAPSQRRGGGGAASSQAPSRWLVSPAKAPLVFV